MKTKNTTFSKRICKLIWCLTLCVLLTPSQVFAQVARPLKVVTSFYPIYITALNIFKDVPDVQIVNLTPSTVGCLHDYSLTTENMKTLADADILVMNGLGMEAFYDRVLKLYPHLKVVEVSSGISPIKDKKDNINPHVWISISGVIQQAQNMAEALEKIDPRHTNIYKQNREDYLGQLRNLKDKMKKALGPYHGAKIITFHEAFPYFAKEFDFEIAGVVEREPGSEPNAQELARTIDLVKMSKIKVIFVEPQYSASSAEIIARETQAKIYFLDPVVTGPAQADAYINIMEKNLETLLTAFGKNSL